MTRDEQLRYCKVCQHQQFIPASGIVCGLTGQPADFEEYCPSFLARPGENPVTDRYVGKTNFDPSVAMASGTKRFINLIVDSIVYYILTLLVGAFSGLVAALMFPDESLVYDDSEGTPLWAYVISISVLVFYYTVMEASFGKTVGKMVTGTRVVDKDGNTPDTGTIFRRSLARCVPFEAFSFLSNSRGWHDKWTDTWVVTNK